MSLIARLQSIHVGVQTRSDSSVLPPTKATGTAQVRGGKKTETSHELMETVELGK